MYTFYWDSAQPVEKLWCKTVRMNKGKEKFDQTKTSALWFPLLDQNCLLSFVLKKAFSASWNALERSIGSTGLYRGFASMRYVEIEETRHRLDMLDEKRSLKNVVEIRNMKVDNSKCRIKFQVSMGRQSNYERMNEISTIARITLTISFLSR